MRRTQSRKNSRVRLIVGDRTAVLRESVGGMRSLDGACPLRQGHDASVRTGWDEMDRRWRV